MSASGANAKIDLAEVNFRQWSRNAARPIASSISILWLSRAWHRCGSASAPRKPLHEADLPFCRLQDSPIKRDVMRLCFPLRQSVHTLDLPDFHSLALSDQSAEANLSGPLLFEKITKFHSAKLLRLPQRHKPFQPRHPQLNKSHWSDNAHRADVANRPADAGLQDDRRLPLAFSPKCGGLLLRFRVQ